MTADEIPVQDLVAMLKEAVWFSAGRDCFDRQGYSLQVSEETAIRDINYRNEPLYPTAEEAIVAHWERNY